MPPRPTNPAGGLNAASAVLDLLSHVGSSVFRSCGIPGCQHHSLGLICKTCRRYMCQRHAYAKPSVPPAFICASCILEEHHEMWDDEAPPAPPPPRARRSRAPDDVIDADWSDE